MRSCNSAIVVVEGHGVRSDIATCVSWRPSSGGYVTQVNELGMKLKPEREHNLAWHRGRKRHVSRGGRKKKNEDEDDKERVCPLEDNECDWLNDEMEGLGDFVGVVMGALLDRMGARLTKEIKH